MREFLLQKTYQFRKPMTNYQVSQNMLLKFRFYSHFIQRSTEFRLRFRLLRRLWINGHFWQTFGFGRKQLYHIRCTFGFGGLQLINSVVAESRSELELRRPE